MVRLRSLHNGIRSPQMGLNSAALVAKARNVCSVPQCSGLVASSATHLNGSACNAFIQVRRVSATILRSRQDAFVVQRQQLRHIRRPSLSRAPSHDVCSRVESDSQTAASVMRDALQDNPDLGIVRSRTQDSADLIDFQILPDQNRGDTSIHTYITPSQNLYSNPSFTPRKRIRIWPRSLLESKEVLYSTAYRTIHSSTRKSEVKAAKPRQDRGGNQAYVALGSNIGDRFEAIESACKIIDDSADMHILATSPLYETEPMYVEEQERFLNGVCKISTKLKPMELLDQLQAIENGLGRVKIIDKGPRNIDLDIVTYGTETVQTERLIVPHKLMREREFVLRPLCDTDGRYFKHPESGKTAAAHLAKLPPSASPMYPLTYLAPGLEMRSLDPRRQTHIMSILNVTPDSFSDGGINQPTDLSKLRTTILSHIAAGATIIDIGGQSSRPNAPDITAEEEIARILPAISLLKSLPEAANIAISVDTYRASVASAAIKAGAHIVNDISSGLLDPDMLPTIAHLGCTYIMMHMRGDPSTMQNSANTTYSNPPGLLPTIKSELLSRLAAAQAAGIRRWRIVLDPGVGFAKTTAQNLEILRRFTELREDPDLRTFPWLVGSSRKGFIGEVTGVREAKERSWATGVTVSAAVQGGAEIVRVHDVAEMRQAVRMADALYRER